MEKNLTRRKKVTIQEKTRSLFKFLVVVISLILLGFPTSKLMADGTHTLGPSNIIISAGSGIVASGTGMLNQPGTIQFDVPPWAVIKQVLLYWEGQMGEIDQVPPNPARDYDIEVDGISITGELIGGPIYRFRDWDKGGVYVYSSGFRANITSYGLVSSGSNILTVSGLEFTHANNGAGVLVIYDDGSSTADIQIRDGHDSAYIYSPYPDNQITKAQTFSFAPKNFDRAVTLAMFFSSVAGRISGAGADRPNSIEITVDGKTTILSNQLASLDDEEWDTLNVPVFIPAWASSLTVEAFSRDDLVTGNLPASFTWNGALLSVNVGGQGCTPGYWKQDQHFDSWVHLSPNQKFVNVFERQIDIRWGKKKNTEDNPTLLQALQAKGGGINALARHAVAALLNAYSLGANSAYPPEFVIAKFQDAVDRGNPQIIEMTKEMFREANESFCSQN